MIKPLKKFFDFWHILKVKIILLYALYHTPDGCFGIDKEQYFRILADYILILILYPFVRFKPELRERKRFSKRQLRDLKKEWNILYRDFLDEYTKHRKTSLANYAYVEIDPPALGSYFSRIVGVAWFCEKLNLNIKFTFPHTYLTGNTDFFENPILANSKECQNEKFMQLEKPLVNVRYRYRLYPSIWEVFGKRKTSSKYGYNILTKLSIKQDIQLATDQWWGANTKQQQQYIGVHYRQTDVVGETRVIAIESYIEYLKLVLDSRYDIFACSDNAQFIDTIHKEFPGKVISRDIARSNDRRTLHRHEPYAGDQQRRDALIDLLILAKTEMIYTVGSFFIETTRFFNPSIKIVALDRRIWPGHKSNSNYLPTPYAHLVKEYQKQVAWKKTLLEKKEPPDIEVEPK